MKGEKYEYVLEIPEISLEIMAIIHPFQFVLRTGGHSH